MKPSNPDNPADIPRETPHQGDQIECSNGPIPAWWRWIFVVTVAIAPPYLLYFHSGVEGRSIIGSYDTKVSQIMKVQLEQLGDLQMNRESVVKYLHAPSWLPLGKSIFKANCASCHGKDGGGLIGPNLCDDQYKNIRDIGDFLNVLNKGANGGAMPAWKGKLSESEIVLVSSYVASLRGTTPGAPKAAEGKTIAAWPPAPQR